MASPKFKQICVGQYSFQGGGSSSFAVIGLDEEGNVWQFKRDGWIRLEEVKNSYTKAEYRTPGYPPRTAKEMGVEPDPNKEPPW